MVNLRARQHLLQLGHLDNATGHYAPIQLAQAHQFKRGLQVGNLIAGEMQRARAFIASKPSNPTILLLPRFNSFNCATPSADAGSRLGCSAGQHTQDFNHNGDKSVMRFWLSVSDSSLVRLAMAADLRSGFGSNQVPQFAQIGQRLHVRNGFPYTKRLSCVSPSSPWRLCIWDSHRLSTSS